MRRKSFDHEPEAVTEKRESAGLTMTELAERVECSLSLISEIESGTRNARPPLLERMADALDCQVSDLARKEAAA